MKLKGTKKKRLFLINLLMITVLCGAVLVQLYASTSKLFAKSSFSITAINKKDVTENQQFFVDLSDNREVKELGKIPVKDPLDLATVDSVLASDDSKAEERTSVTRDWQVSIPEGLVFDESTANERLLEEDKEIELPIFNWNEEERTLGISVNVEQTTLRLPLTAEKSGDYTIALSDAEDTSDSAELKLAVEKSNQTASSDEVETSEIAPAKETVKKATRAATADVTDWETFVKALADTTITTISLQNDIVLSGTLQNYDNLFSTASVDMTSAENVYFHINKAASSRSITIDGNGKTFNFGNLAIGLLNASTTGSAQAYWVFDFVNIDVISRNYSGPIYKSSHTAASATTNGLTGTPRTNTKINFTSTATHVREVATFYGYLAAFMDVNVPKMSVVDDLILPTTSMSPISTYYQYSPYANNSQAVIPAVGIASGSAAQGHFSVNGTARELVVDGNGYTFDFASLGVALDAGTTGGTTSGWDVTYKNMTVYHGNWWGAMFFYGIPGKATYENYTDYGDQMMESDTTTLVFRDKVHLEKVKDYTSKRKDGSTIRNWATYSNTQSMISVNSATVEPNAVVNLVTNGVDAIRVATGGTFEIGKDAVVNVTRNEETGVGTGEHTNAAIGIQGTGKFFVRSGAKLTVENHHTRIASSIYLANAGSQFIVEPGAEVNVSIDQYNQTNTSTAYDNIPVYMGGGTLTVGGVLNVTATNNASNGSNIVHANAAATFTVQKDGVLDIKSDSTHYQQNLIYMGGSTTTTTFQFSDAKRVNLQRMVPLSTGTNNTNSGLINSRGILDVSVQNVYQWNYNSVSGGADGDSDFDHDYVPMSNMKINYANNAVSSIGSANAMTSTTLTAFKANFTTQAQRVLFTRIPDPSIDIHSISNDNPSDPGSVTIYGYAIPNTYVRLWEEPKNGTTSALAHGGSQDTIPTPIQSSDFDPNAVDENGNKVYSDDPTKNYTVQANANGDWTYTIPSGGFSAGNIIHAFAFANLKSEEATQVVLDKTPPTGDPVDYHSAIGEAAPTAEKFVTNPADTNPVRPTFTYEFAEENTPADIAALMNIQGTHPVWVYILDSAVDADGNLTPNKTKIQANLIIHQTLNYLEAEDVAGKASDINAMTDAQLKAWIIAQSNADSAKIVDGVQSSLNNFIEVSSLGGLTPATKEGTFTVKLIVPAAASGLANTLEKEIQVYITGGVVSKDKTHALDGKDFLIASKDYPTSEADIISMIRTQGGLKLTQILPKPAIDLDVTNISINKDALPGPRVPGTVIPAGVYDVHLSYGTGDSEVKLTIKVTIEKSETKLNVRFVDENNQDIVPKLEFDVFSGQTFDLAGNAEVKQKIEDAKAEYYDLDSRPADEAVYPIDQDPTEAVYRFTGKLVISEVPVLDFGLKEALLRPTRVENADLNGEQLKITDTRPTRSKWTLKAKLLQEFTLVQDGNTTLTGVLRYNDGGTTEKTFALNNAEDIAQHTNSDKEYVLSDIWQEKGPGFKLDIPGAAVKKIGEYQAIVEYQLSDTP